MSKIMVPVPAEKHSGLVLGFVLQICPRASKWTNVGFGIALTVLTPALIWFGHEGLLNPKNNEANTMIGGACAAVVGYLIALKIIQMPTVESFTATLSAFTWSYLAVVLVFFLFRIEYSRPEFILSYVTALGWFWLAFRYDVGARRRSLTIVPFGAVEDLETIGKIDWQIARHPQGPPPQSDGVVADLRAELTPEWQEWLTKCVLDGTPVYHVKTLRESYTGRLEIEHLSENMLGSLNPDGAYLAIKRVIDTVVAVVALAPALPLLALVALIVKLDSPGPVLFTQQRVGYRGERFKIYKFRTMAHRAASKDAAQALHDAKTQDDDPRISKVGRFLRKWRIDELPQILNIIRGEMSWIGPRPEAVPLSDWYRAKLPFYAYRHIVRPGISGWAQVNQGHVTAEGEVLEKLHYDFYYIRNLSMWMDAIIVMKTIRTILTGFGAR